MRLILQAIVFGLNVASVTIAGGQAYLSTTSMPGQSNLAIQNYDAELFTPLESLELLSESRFSTLRHPMFPYHSVRIKKTSFCDDTVRYALGNYHFWPYNAD